MKINTGTIFQSILIALSIAILTGGFKFYNDWTTDEALEEAQMQATSFDDEGQKVKTLEHVENIPTVDMKVKMERDVDFQKQVLEELKQMRKIDTLNADQVYQIKEEIKKIKSHH